MNDLTVILRERNPETDPDCHAAADLIDMLRRRERRMIQIVRYVAAPGSLTTPGLRRAAKAFISDYEMGKV